MLSPYKRYREFLIVAVLLAYPFASFLITGRKGRDPNWIDRSVLAVASPLQRALNWAVEGGAQGWRHYAALRGVRRDYEVLQEEDQRLRARLMQLEEARAENVRLKRMLGYAESNPGPEVPARVVGVNPVSTLISLRIDRGESDGVRRGMPVVTPDGVVGRIHRATGGYADVVLITDPNSKLGVKVQRSRARATATGGGGSHQLRLENALRTEDLRDGDLILTSGTDGVYPPGLVVGRVTGIDRKAYGMFQTADVIPAVDMSKLEEVLVLPSPPASGSDAPSAGGKP